MKRTIYLFLLILLTVTGTAWSQEVPPPPNPPRLVNDFAKQLNATEIQALEQKLVAYNDSTSSQVTIVIVPTTQPYTIDEYAIQILRTWGVGQEGKDNGIVMLWAPEDRKVFIATGYGMEGVIPDAIAKRIISQVIIPEFKNGMYYKGLSEGADAIFKYATGEYKADAVQKEEGIPASFIIFLVIFIIIIIFIGRNKGGKGGGFQSSGPVFWPYSTFSGGGHSSGDWGGGFGGGFGGGGFGGFGGGSGGGGGAGGSY